MEEIYIRSLHRLPTQIKAVTIIDQNGDYNVYVNANLNQDTQDKACKHELNHIYENHFYDHQPVLINEQEASRLIKKKDSALTKRDGICPHNEKYPDRLPRNRRLAP